MLDFEGSWWLYPQPKDRAIKEYLGMTSTRYYQILRRLVDDDEAVAYDPLTVRRVRRVRTMHREVVASRVGDGDGVR